MATLKSPADPIFWPFTAYLDRLFAQWQANHPVAIENMPDNFKKQILVPFDLTVLKCIQD